MLGLGLAVHKQIPQKNIVRDGLVLYLDGKDFKNSPPTQTWRDRSGKGNDATPSNFGYINNIPASTTTDFQGKIAGDLNSNANVVMMNNNIILLSPSSFTSTELITGVTGTEWNGYKTLSTQDGKSIGMTASSPGQLPQILKKFNVIAAIEKMLGKPIPTSDGTVASKINWIKANVSQLIAKAWIWGSCPTGNKAYVCLPKSDGSWDTTSAQNTVTANSSTLTTLATGNINRIDSNGIMNVLAYTDAARSTDSTLLVLTGHGLSTSDLIENTTRSTFSGISNITSNTITTSSISGQTAGDSIRKYRNLGNKTATVVGATTPYQITIANHGLVTGDAVIVQGKGYSRVTVIDANNFTLDNTSIPAPTTSDTYSLKQYLGTQTAESTVIPSTIYCDYISLEIDFADQSSGSDNAGGVVFDGIDDYVVSNYKYPAGSLPKSFHVKFKLNSLGVIQVICGGGSGTSISTFGLYINTNSHLYFWAVGSDIDTGISLALNIIYDVQVSYDGNYIKIFLNGNLINNQAIALTTGTTNGVTLGSGYSAFYSKPTIYHFSAYNRALTDAEILKNYRASK